MRGSFATSEPAADAWPTAGNQTVHTLISRHRSPEELVSAAAIILRDEGARQLAPLDAFPAPLYATDGEGRIVYHNRASVDFAGRTPTLFVDRWCVSWKLHTDEGAALAHDACPMAVAIRERRPVRGATAWAERPDGARTRFQPFPTPALDEGGQVVGAVNLLIPLDDTIRRDLIAKADKCRHLAQWVTDRSARDTLRQMARECEGQAAALRLD